MTGFTVDELLDHLRGRGIDVSRQGEQIGLHPENRVTAEERAMVRRRTAALLELLRTEERMLPHWPAAIPGVGSRRLGPGTDCAICLAGTAVQFGGIPYCSTCAQDLDGARRRQLYHARRAMGELWERATRSEDSLAALDDARQHVLRLRDVVGEPRASDLRRRSMRDEWARFEDQDR
jgi:hypothetical protein